MCLRLTVSNLCGVLVMLSETYLPGMSKYLFVFKVKSGLGCQTHFISHVQRLHIHYCTVIVERISGFLVSKSQFRDGKVCSLFPGLKSCQQIVTVGGVPGTPPLEGHSRSTRGVGGPL